MVKFRGTRRSFVIMQSLLQSSQVMGAPGYLIGFVVIVAILILVYLFAKRRNSKNVEQPFES